VEGGRGTQQQEALARARAASGAGGVLRREGLRDSRKSQHRWLSTLEHEPEGMGV